MRLARLLRVLPKRSPHRQALNHHEIFRRNCHSKTFQMPRNAAWGLGSQQNAKERTPLSEASKDKTIGAEDQAAGASVDPVPSCTLWPTSVPSSARTTPTTWSRVDPERITPAVRKR